LIRRVARRYSKGTISPHDVRRFFATEWLRRGGSESSLVRLCGWRDDSMLRTYVRAHADVLALAEYRRLQLA
jgi:integrase